MTTDQKTETPPYVFPHSIPHNGAEGCGAGLLTREGLGWVYEQRKKYPEAIAELEQAVRLSNRHEDPLSSRRVLAESGRKREAEKVLAEMNRRSRVRYVSPCLIALVQAGLGQRDQAMSSFEQVWSIATNGCCI